MSGMTIKFTSLVQIEANRFVPDDDSLYLQEAEHPRWIRTTLGSAIDPLSHGATGRAGWELPADVGRTASGTIDPVRLQSARRAAGPEPRPLGNQHGQQVPTERVNWRLTLPSWCRLRHLSAGRGNSNRLKRLADPTRLERATFAFGARG